MAEPQALPQTIRAGQPKLMSMIFAPNSTAACAAEAISEGSAPSSCTVGNRSCASQASLRIVMSVARSPALLETISPTTSEAPRRRQILRKGTSVTPAMGASTTPPSML